MRKSFALLALLALAACAGNEKGPKSLGIGVYPGDPDENFSPVLQKDDGGYRNIALLRAARHSSCADYNQTAQLVTDGLVSEGPAAWVELFRNGEKLALPDGTFLTDQNHAGILCGGPEEVFELVFHEFFHSVSISHETVGITKIVMRNMAVIEHVVIVVKCPSVIAFLIQLTSHDHIVMKIRSDLERRSSFCGQKTEDILIFSSGCSCTGWLIIIRETESLLSKSI